MYLVASVRLSVHQCVLSCLNHLTLIFGIGVDLDLGKFGIVGQGRRSKVTVKCKKSCFDITVTSL